MSANPKQIDVIFLDALEISDPAARTEYLNQACGDDVQIRARVERMLIAMPRMGDFLDQPAFGTAGGDETNLPQADDLSGQAIGPFKLLQKLGEGGMGVVYLAEQEQPVRRRVALKVIRAGLDSSQIVARFEHERQALALMDHPNIARVLDAGMTDNGRPYFAMELVHGVPITKYCDQELLSLQDRIKLFIPICRAIQHAHQKGIIHRDLKPSNVIVALYDGQPVPKVIDFGVAKATGQQLVERTRFTEFGQLIGTMEYMAPEQAEMDNLDIDTRADVYSLGVLLYELLTGSPPFTAQALRKAGLGEMFRMIKEVEPSKPSTKITNADDLPRVAANRRLEPQRLARLVRGDLDWITMKCLEKTRSRRYDTANGLAHDLERFLSDEPVLACPPTTGYRFMKFVRRHRVSVIAATLIVLSLIGGIVGTTVGLFKAKQQERLAVAAQAKETQAKQREKERADAEAKERQRAEAAEAEAEAIIDFLRSDLIGQAGSLAQADRAFEPNPNLTVREALDRVAAVVGEKFADRPDIEAAIRKTIGESYLQLGLYEKAIEQLEKSTNIREQRLGAEHPGTLDARDNLAQAYRGAARFAEAIILFEQNAASRTKSLGPDDLATLITRDNLAVAYRDGGRTADALALFEQVRLVKLKTLGPDHPRTLVTLHNLASMYMDIGNFTEAVASLEQVHAARVKVLGPDHPETLPSLQNLAVAYWKTKQLEKSIPRFEQLLNLSREVHGDEHPHTLEAIANLGVNYRDAGRFDEAIEMLEQARRGGANPSKFDWMDRELLIAYERSEQFDKGAALAKEILSKSRKSLPEKSPQLASALALAGSTLLRLKAWSDAEPVLRECLAIREELEPDEWRTFNTKALLGESLLGQSKFADAEPMLLQGRAGLVEREEKIPLGFKPRLQATAERLVELYEAWGKPDEAAKWRETLSPSRE